MRSRFISFARLPPGSYFDARGATWIKCPGMLDGDGTKFNAYHSEFDHLDANASVKIGVFPDEMLVKYDPEEGRAQWAEFTDH